jgi:hypothetical protein
MGPDPEVAVTGSTATGSAGRRPWSWPWAAALSAVLVVPLIVAIGLTALSPGATDPTSARLVSASTLEADYGVRFDMVAVTAAGGLVDLRFVVVDAAKAANLFHDSSSSPALLVDGSGAVLRMRKGMNHNISFLTGSRYFVLFPNAGGAVQRGTRVSVVIDDIRLEPIAVQS